MPVAALLLALLAVPAVSQDDGVVIFAPDKTAAMLVQCSRATPKAGESGWTPGMGDIARMEAKLPAALRLMRPDPFLRKELEAVPRGWLRQYVGIIRGGKRYIYGSYAPDTPGHRSYWRTQPIDICDGGPTNFGAEYDVESDAIDHLAFNGMA
ncbi:hypothetical protein P6144_04585 [Sphingomonas sp. HITSZ_GF]|uniref:hypothetical protein n=1 Tax=Sphingomonas sp. HITSZ_GF TaxID=3037247 RepID=UPI00240D821F|nr:hypothetical protein [Sphingomonas sp. HITSZ_GF]MDG2532912.1 hypothetical protein [Sphingomonas sp. HITSZ_GF]